MIVYRTTDRIPIKVGELKFWVSPFTYEQKIKLNECKKMVAGGEVLDAAKVAILSLKFAVKEVQGLIDSESQPYEVAFEADGTLTDECVSDLWTVVGAPSVAALCYKLSLEIADHELDGAKVVLSEVKRVQKKT